MSSYFLVKEFPVFKGVLLSRGPKDGSHLSTYCTNKTSGDTMHKTYSHYYLNSETAAVRRYIDR